MDQVDDLLKRLCDLNSQAERSLEAARKEDDRLRQQIKEAIKAGQSTGDRIRDYCCVHGSHWLSELETVLRKIETRLIGKIGQLILMVEREEHRHDEHLDLFDHGLIEEDLTLGVLLTDKLQLDMQSGQSLIPVNKHVRSPHWKEPLARDGGFWLQRNMFPFLVLDLPLELKHRPEYYRLPAHGKPSNIALELVVGNGPVQNWFIERCCGKRIKPALILWRMIKLLDATDCQLTDLDGVLCTHREDLLAKLAELRDKRQELFHQLEQIEVKRECIRHLPEQVIDVHENIMTARGEMLNLLKQACDLGLKDNQLVQRVASELRVPLD